MYASCSEKFVHNSSPKTCSEETDFGAPKCRRDVTDTIDLESWNLEAFFNGEFPHPQQDKVNARVKLPLLKRT